MAYLWVDLCDSVTAVMALITGLVTLNMPTPMSTQLPARLLVLNALLNLSPRRLVREVVMHEEHVRVIRRLNPPHSEERFPNGGSTGVQDVLHNLAVSAELVAMPPQLDQV